MKNAAFVLFALLVVCGSVIVYAVSNQIWSNDVTETLTAYSVVLSSNNSSPLLGGMVEFSALLTGNGVPLAQRQIDFYRNNAFNVSETTGGDGVAKLLWVADESCTWKALYTAP